MSNDKLNLQDVQKIINDHIELVEVNAKSMADAANRAAKFLVAQSILASFLKGFEDDKTKLESARLAQYAQSIRCTEGKNITEKKVYVEADPGYAATRELVEQIETIHSYIKTHMKIFDNAHVMFRQMSRE